MAILKKIAVSGDDWSLWGANIPERCFTCGEQLHFPVVYWAGCNGSSGTDNSLQIALHPYSANNLPKNLMSDANKKSSRGWGGGFNGRRVISNAPSYFGAVGVVSDLDTDHKHRSSHGANTFVAVAF